MQFFIPCDKYYFVTNIFHMLKFTNVCWSFFNLIFLSLSLIQYTTNKINPICDVYIYTKNTKCKNAIFVIIIFGGCSVLLPMCQKRWNKSANLWHEGMGHISQGCLQTMVHKHIPIRLFNLNDTNLSSFANHAMQERNVGHYSLKEWLEQPYFLNW